MDIQEMIQIDRSSFMNTFGDRTPIAFSYGKDSTLYDLDHKPYIDFLAGIAVNSLGYDHKIFIQAVEDQLHKLLHCSNIFYIEAQSRLIQQIAESIKGYKVFFGNSGAEANEGAIKLARKYFSSRKMNKYEIITAKNSFHGRTLATLAATGQEKYHKPFEPMPSGFINVDYNSLEAIDAAITDNTCAVMIETIQGEGGVIEGTTGYLQGLRNLCTTKGLLLIIDEIQTGMGRTGKLYSFQHFGIQPDIFTLAKALGNGIPIGAIVARSDVADAFQPGDHGSTFGGNPLACAAGAVVMDIMLHTSLIDECAYKGSYFKTKLYTLKEKYSFIRDVRGMGLMLGVELDPAVSGKEIVLKALEKGFIINCAAHNTLRFIPPLIITKEEIDQLFLALQEIFDKITI